jgi:DNA-binding MarR family transcriptional regulator
LLGQICRLHHARAHTLLDALGLYRGQPRLLHKLEKQEGLTHTELAALLNVTPPTITKMVQRMEQRGFVARREDPEDQRISRVYLTPTGRAVLEDMHQTLQALDEEALVGFTLEERVLLRRLLLQVRQNLLDAVEEDQNPCQC